MIDFLHVQLLSRDWPRQQISLRQAKSKLITFTKLDYKLVDASGGFLKLGDLMVGETPDTSVSGLVSPRAVLIFYFVPPGGQQ